MGAGVALSGVAVFLYQGLITLCASFIAPFLSEVVIAEMKCVGSLLIIGLSFNMLGMTKIKVMNLCPRRVLPDPALHLYVNSCKGTPPVDRRGFLIFFASALPPAAPERGGGRGARPRAKSFDRIEAYCSARAFGKRVGRRVLHSRCTAPSASA